MKTRTFHTVLAAIILLGMLSLQTNAQSKGTIYIIYGSDTAIWSGMNTGKRFPTYDLSLYTSPSENAAAIMQPSFRQEIVDSYGQPLIMTWWMMAGNIFRDGTNTNVPYPNMMTMHLMKKYYRDAIGQWGDELSLHYHTFYWSDYDGDGAYWWNQAKTFEECRDDWDVTLAQQLIEEDVFPVSFRSGWHFMDNAWQQRLDELLPFSMHNAYPSRKLTDTEPLDNVIDWSRAPSTWVPYHPDPQDYQVPGPGRGWNLRSRSLYGATRDVLEPAFVEAFAGNDQIMCLWDHLPDDNIFDNLRRVNALLHTLAGEYPGVTFRFTSAVEGMQLFLGMADSAAPIITAGFEGSGSAATLRISTDEALFQPIPFVAVKTLGEEYRQLEMTPVGQTEWVSTSSLDTADLAHIAIAATDTSGNVATWHHAFVPRTVFIDDASEDYTEHAGNWITMSTDTWGTTARQAQLSVGDSGTVSWTYAVTDSRPYTVALQIPSTATPPQAYRMTVTQQGHMLKDTLVQEIPYDSWYELGVYTLTEAQNVTIALTGYAETAEALMTVDVVRISPLVPRFRIVSGTQELSLGFISRNDPITVTIRLHNSGLSDVSVMSFAGETVSLVDPPGLPLLIPTGQTVDLICQVTADTLGSVSDTVVIGLDAQILEDIRIPVRMTVEKAVQVVDNDDVSGYTEGGNWQNSVVTSYGSTSRYVLLSRGGGQYARYQTTIQRSGFYRISFLIPSSENATDRARYSVHAGSSHQGDIVLSQRPGGSWTDIGVYEFIEDSTATVTIWNDGDYTSGTVMRADAMKFSLVDVQPVDIYVLDNDSAGVYQEFGAWQTSVAQAEGASSRYAWVADGPGTRATFTFQVWQSDIFRLEYIVPSTENAATNAVYRVLVDGVEVHMSQRNQNEGSGGWISLGEYTLPAFRPVQVEIGVPSVNAGGTVLRADAVRAVRLVTNIQDPSSSETPLTFQLSEVYPNPFNPTTTMSFTLPEDGDVKLVVHDLLGRVVQTIFSGTKRAGEYRVQWHGRNDHGMVAPSGVYFVRYSSGRQSMVRKMVLMK